jgi:D-glycero-alpha-D-manno-heptose-7-phosphate kinase
MNKTEKSREAGSGFAREKTSIEIPVRADLAGGTSDIAFYLEKYGVDHGAVVNISLPVKIEIKVSIDNSSDKVKVIMPDLGEVIEGDLAALQDQEKDNACQIISHFLGFFALNHKGLRVEISSRGKIPPASGLGTSSAMGVGLVEVLADLYGVYGINPAEFTYLVETSMGMLGGKQDYYAAWLAGLNYMIFHGPQKSLVSIKKSFSETHPLYRWVLEKMVIYYCGESRSSGKMNQEFKAKIAEDPSVFAQIALQADRAFEAILNKDEKNLSQAINRDREIHLQLSSLYYSKKMRLMAKEGEKLGYAHRGCGAGGGGCLLFFAAKKDHHELLKRLNPLGGLKIK